MNINSIVKILKKGRDKKEKVHKDQLQGKVTALHSKDLILKK